MSENVEIKAITTGVTGMVGEGVLYECLLTIDTNICRGKACIRHMCWPVEVLRFGEKVNFVIKQGSIIFSHQLFAKCRLCLRLDYSSISSIV